MFGAVAAGSSRGGYDTIQEAAKQMVHLQEQSYSPITAHQAMYDELYMEYRQLHDYFGRGSNYVMPRLKQLQKKAVTTS